VTYALRLSGPAEKRFARLDRTTQRLIVKRLEELVMNPYDPRISKPLTNLPGKRSCRVGRVWRLVYEVNQAMSTVEVVALQSRGEVYQRL